MNGPPKWNSNQPSHLCNIYQVSSPTMTIHSFRCVRKNTYPILKLLWLKVGHLIIKQYRSVHPISTNCQIFALLHNSRIVITMNHLIKQSPVRIQLLQYVVCVWFLCSSVHVEYAKVGAYLECGTSTWTEVGASVRLECYGVEGEVVVYLVKVWRRCWNDTTCMIQL